ncbi:MAG: gluconeogenesis factor YvcK family protein [Patescibacteria group bacterium]|nr:gluconeogenesis factor YvcK family protein [Patescibacteria group bacterium]
MTMKKRIVTIGGGTGSFAILSGLKQYDDLSISAIVSMADDGGSTGRLRDELGVLPPGDVRQCLVALSKESQAVRDLFNYRFEKGELKGHAAGNIFLSALEKKSGSFSEGLEIAMKIINIKGKVIPVTNDCVNLQMKLKDGTYLKGEEEVNHDHTIQKIGLKDVFLKPKAKLNPKAEQAVKRAHVIVIGPGNHYCSIITNLLVQGMGKALRNSKAKVVYIANLVNKKGHTDGFTLDDYVDSINGFIGAERIDYVIYNSQKPSEFLEKKYKRRGETIVRFDEPERKKRNYTVITSHLLGKTMQYSKADKIASSRSLIRHDSVKLAKLIRYISEADEFKRLIKKIV